MSRRVRLILAAAGIVIVAILFFVFFINPIRGDIGQVQTSIDQEIQTIDQLQAQVDQAPNTRSEGRRSQGRLIELAKMIPADSEIPSLILQIQDLADKAGIEWMQITLGQPGGAEGAEYLILPLSLNFTGTFFDMNDFIYRAEQMVAGPGRLLTLKDISFSPSGEGSGSPEQTVSMTMYAFVMAPAAAPAPAEATATGDGTAEPQ